MKKLSLLLLVIWTCIAHNNVEGMRHSKVKRKEIFQSFSDALIQKSKRQKTAHFQEEHTEKNTKSKRKRTDNINKKKTQKRKQNASKREKNEEKKKLVVTTTSSHTHHLIYKEKNKQFDIKMSFKHDSLTIVLANGLLQNLLSDSSPLAFLQNNSLMLVNKSFHQTVSPLASQNSLIYNHIKNINLIGMTHDHQEQIIRLSPSEMGQEGFKKLLNYCLKNRQTSTKQQTQTEPDDHEMSS